MAARSRERRPAFASEERGGPDGQPALVIRTDAAGWTVVSDVYRAPSQAVEAVVELHLQWATHAEVRWSGISLAETAPPIPRTVRLATVHFRPSGGKTPLDNCRAYALFIAEAARQKADLVVLGETITFVGLGKRADEVAETIPGPSTA